MGLGDGFGEMFGEELNNMLGNLGGGVAQIKFLVINTSPGQPVIITENTEVALSPKAVDVTDDEKIPDITYEDIGGLSEEVKKRLQKVMPGFSSNLHKHEWIKHGTCYGTDANMYYEDAISMVEQMNNSKVGHFFTQHIGKHVTLQQVRELFDRNFGVGAGKRVEFKCDKGLITELWLHLGSESDDLGTRLKQGKQTRSHCQGGLVDKAGF